MKLSTVSYGRDTELDYLLAAGIDLVSTVEYNHLFAGTASEVARVAVDIA